MAETGQAPVPYEPKYTKDTGDGHVEFVRQAPDGLIGNDGSDDRVLYGHQLSGFGTGNDFGIKVSRAGVNVRDATDDQLIMSSAFNMFKIVASGTATVTATLPGSDGAIFSTVVAHNLGYVPAHAAFVFDILDSSYSLLPFTDTSFNATVSARVIDRQIYAVADTSNITFLYSFGYAGIPYTTHSIEVKYYLFRETAS